MKKSVTRVVLGGFAVTIVAVLISQYQNCAQSGTGSGFNITMQGSSSFFAAAPTLNNSTYTPAGALSASSFVTGGSGSILCQWIILTNPGGALVPPVLPSAPAVNGSCNLSAIAPTALGSYKVTVTGTDSTGASTSGSSLFSVASVAATPTPVPSAGPTQPTTTPIPLHCSFMGCTGFAQCGVTQTLTCAPCAAGKTAYCVSPTTTQSCGTTCAIGGGCGCH